MSPFALFVLLAAFAAESAAECPVNGNKCARAITATAQLAARRADCSAFQRCVITPATSTFLSTVTTTPPVSFTTVTDTTITLPAAASPKGRKRAVAADPPLEVHERRHGEAHARGGLLERRQNGNSPVTNCPTEIPVYASACTTGGTSFAYASACSCAGATKVYTTIASPTTTKLVTATAIAQTQTIHTTNTVYTAAGPPPPPSPFVIQVGDSGSFYIDTRLDDLDDTVLYYHDFRTPDARTQATSFRITTSAGLVTTQGFPITTLLEGYNSELYALKLLGSPVRATLGAYNAATGGYAITINLPPGFALMIDGNGIFIAANNPQGLYAAPALYAVGLP